MSWKDTRLTRNIPCPSLVKKRKEKRFEASWPCYLDGIGVVRIRNGVEQIWRVLPLHFSSEPPALFQQLSQFHTFFCSKLFQHIFKTDKSINMTNEQSIIRSKKLELFQWQPVFCPRWWCYNKCHIVTWIRVHDFMSTNRPVNPLDLVSRMLYHDSCCLRCLTISHDLLLGCFDQRQTSKKQG